MKTRLLSLAAASLLFPGCFSPEVDPEVEGSEASDGSSSGTDTGTPPTSAGTDDPTATTTPSTTDDPTTTNPSTTDQPTTTDDSTTDDDSGSGGPEPFCGDGNLDPGEDCDDGDGNGLDQACLPDCNLNVCGDGNLAPDEVCDDGDGNNVLEVGACAPDCSTIVQEKVITVSGGFVEGNLSPNPVASADAMCEPGFSAMMVYPNSRRATTVPFETEDPIDWVLHPWTVYVRPDGVRVWATDETALLGVRDGTPMALEASIAAPSEAFGYQSPSGLSEDWTTAAGGNCDGWSSTAATVRYGRPDSADYPDYLRVAGTGSCDFMSQCVFLPGQPGYCARWSVFACVEQ